MNTQQHTETHRMELPLTQRLRMLSVPYSTEHEAADYIEQLQLTIKTLEARLELSSSEKNDVIALWTKACAQRDELEKLLDSGCIKVQVPDDDEGSQVITITGVDLRGAILAGMARG